MTTKTAQHLMHELAILSQVHVRLHVETEDGEKCFNLHTFLEDLESAVDTRLDCSCGRFQVDAGAVARLLWCYLTLANGDRPDGDTFRGMPILG